MVVDEILPMHDRASGSHRLYQILRILLEQGIHVTLIAREKHLAEHYLIPLQELGYRISELPKNKEIVVYCRVGNRSAYACSYLSRLGYKVKNLEGGIVLWNMSGNVSLAKV